MAIGLALAKDADIYLIDEPSAYLDSNQRMEAAKTLRRVMEKAGTSALIMRNKNGINWVVLMNTSTKGKSRIHNEVSKIMFKAVRSVEEWPDYDLFNYNNIEPALAEK